MNADKQLNRIFRQAMRAEAALMQADELITDLCNSNAVDYHVASTLSHLLPRALPPVQDIIEYTRSIPAPYQKGN
jgi:hypothetical protein